MAENLAQADDVVAAPADTSQPVNETEEQTKTVQELMDEGVESLSKAKYAEAAELFSLAVEKLVEKYGERAIETVDALEAYGNALLKNAIASSGVLGENAGNKTKTEDSTAQPAAADSAASILTSAGAIASSSKTSASKTEPVTANNINFHFGGDAQDDDDEEEDDAEANDEEGEEGAAEEDDLETAWKVLDLVRVILSDQTSEERKLQLARVRCSIAEVATESAQPDKGVEEYEAALAIQKSILPAWDRLIAQTHLFTALALELIPNNQFDAEENEARIAKEAYDKAIEHIQSAKDVLRLRDLHIKGIDEGKGKQKENGNIASSSKELSEKEKDEVEDIAGLQVELDNKIEDLRAQAADVDSTKKSLAEQVYEKPTSLPEGVSREVHNLNTLVKKKPKKPVDAAGQANGGSHVAETTPVSPANGHKTEQLQDAAAPNADNSAGGVTKRKAEDDLAKDTQGTDSAVNEKKAKIDTA